MEILIYISGVFTAALVVSIVSFIRTNKKYTSLLESNQHNINISSIRSNEANERMGEIEEIIRVIQNEGYAWSLRYVRDRVGSPVIPPGSVYPAPISLLISTNKLAPLGAVECGGDPWHPTAP